jgi:hypothetical protein
VFTVGDEPGGHLQGGVPVLAAREVLHTKQGYCQEDIFVHCKYFMWKRMSTLYTDKKVNKFSSCIRKFRWDRLQSHI